MKGQSANEYLVLLAVVLIVAMVAIALSGFFPEGGLKYTTDNDVIDGCKAIACGNNLVCRQLIDVQAYTNITEPNKYYCQGEVMNLSSISENRTYMPGTSAWIEIGHLFIDRGTSS